MELNGTDAEIGAAQINGEINSLFTVFINKGTSEKAQYRARGKEVAVVQVDRG